ncbi:MAG: hypothetical protein QOD55_1107 [Solirubrobacteraceae bacterium]|jgi:uncharacterized membrane protein|nr:hypothetical protein [Solirubrobacteraceae bacterium]MEA2289110.1 hypothetical protein [Solirubrobacteraceae bacterium]
MLRYDLLLLGHILATVTLVGGTLMLQLLALLAARSPGSNELLTVSRQASWIAPRVFLPAAAVTMATGLALASESGYELDQLYLLFGFAVLVAGSAAGPLYLAPEAKRIGRLIAADGTAGPEVGTRLRRLFLVTRVELILLVLAVAGMVLKPSF